MPRTIPIQTSFAGGELSPKLKGRVDTDLWKKGLDECINWEPLAHGPLLSRGGTRHAVDFSTLTSKCRLIEFPRQGDVGFLLVLGGGSGTTPGTLSVRSGIDGSAVLASAIDWVKNPRFTLGWNYWTNNTPGWWWSLYWLLGPAFTVGSNHYLAQCPLLNTDIRPYIKQTTSLVPDGTYTLSIRYGSAAGCTLAILVGTTDGGTEVFTETFPSTGALDNLTTVTRTITVAADAVLYVKAETVGMFGEAVVGGPDGLVAGNRIEEVAIRATGGTAAEWTQATTPKMPWTDDQLAELQFVSEPAKDRCMFFHPAVDPYELIYDSATAAWTFAKITFTFNVPLTPDWASPNFPGVAELYQGRLFLGGIPGKLNTLLASKSGDPYDFSSSVPANAADAFSLDLSTKGGIRWMHGHRVLLLGTDRGEHVVVAQAGVLTPSDFEVRPQSGFGSAAVQAVAVGDQAMYVSRDRRRLRMLSFNLQENGWQTRDLTFTSEHLTGGLIQDMDWLSTGNDTVYGLMRSGEVVAWSFNKPEQVIAPWRLDFGGLVYALCVLEAGDQDKVWMLVQRAGTVCLEEWLVADDPERCLLDSYSVTTQTAGVVSGLERLQGVSVIAILDGVATEPQTVTAGGTITVDATATVVIVGLYSPRSFTTLPKEGGQPGGTAAGSKQRFVSLSLRLNDSALPLVDGKRAAPDRTPSTPMGTVEPRMTGDVKCHLLGWNSHGQVTVTQDKPIRTEVLALYGVLSTSEV